MLPIRNPTMYATNNVVPTSKQLNISAGVMIAETVMQTAKAIAVSLKGAFRKYAIVAILQRAMVNISSVVPIIILFLRRTDCQVS